MYDWGCSYDSASYGMNHLDLPAEQSSNVTSRFYLRNHILYTDPPTYTPIGTGFDVYFQLYNESSTGSNLRIKKGGEIK